MKGSKAGLVSYPDEPQKVCSWPGVYSLYELVSSTLDVDGLQTVLGFISLMNPIQSVLLWYNYNYLQLGCCNNRKESAILSTSVNFLCGK